MATRTVRTSDLSDATLSDDVTPTLLTLQDGRDSFAVEIDLADDEFKALAKALLKYRDAGRVKAPKGARTASNTNHENYSDGPAVRAWARANGFPDTKDRGAIPAAVLAAYDARDRSADTNDVDA